jgi:hypothetical protein
MITQFQAETLLLALLAGACAALLLYAMVPREVTARRRQAAARRARTRRRLARRTLAALAAGLAAAIATGWPVAGLGALGLVLFWDGVAGGVGAERAKTRRVEALAKWTETLRDTMAGAAGLEQAIPAAARTAAPVLAEPLAGMVEQLRSRATMTEALYTLADALDDPDADPIIAALLLNSRLRGPGLNKVLTALASVAREEVAARERITAQRASARRGVQVIVAVTIGLIGASAVFDHDFVAPYDTALGQLVLAGILAIFTAGFAWLRRLANVQVGRRFLQRPAPQTGDAP